MTRAKYHIGVNLPGEVGVRQTLPDTFVESDSKTLVDAVKFALDNPNPVDAERASAIRSEVKNNFTAMKTLDGISSRQVPLKAPLKPLFERVPGDFVDGPRYQTLNIIVASPKEGGGGYD